MCMHVSVSNILNEEPLSSQKIAQLQSQNPGGPLELEVVRIPDPVT